MSETKELQLETEWRKHVSDSLLSLTNSVFGLRTDIGSARTENATQHGEVSSRLGTLEGRVGGLETKIEIALADANRRLESRYVVIRFLVAVLIFLMGILGGVKATASGLFKMLGLE